MNKRENNSRRKFLSFLTRPLHHELTDQSKNVMLLTADGKLVEVANHLVQQAKSGSKATNQEILTWSKSTNPKL